MHDARFVWSSAHSVVARVHHFAPLGLPQRGFRGMENKLNVNQNAALSALRRDGMKRVMAVCTSAGDPPVFTIYDRGRVVGSYRGEWRGRGMTGHYAPVDPCPRLMAWAAAGGSLTAARSAVLAEGYGGCSVMEPEFLDALLDVNGSL